MAPSLEKMYSYTKYPGPQPKVQYWKRIAHLPCTHRYNTIKEKSNKPRAELTQYRTRLSQSNLKSIYLAPPRRSFQFSRIFLWKNIILAKSRPNFKLSGQWNSILRTTKACVKINETRYPDIGRIPE